MTNPGSKHWIERLSEYVDGDLGIEERRAADAHFTECGECAKALNEVEAIVREASRLTDPGPERDLWPAISAALDEADAGVIDLSRRLGRPARELQRSVRLTVPQLAAAGIALALFSGALSWSLAPGTSTDAVALENGSEPARVVPASSAERAAELAPRYADELAQLQELLAENQDELDPSTVRVVEKNLDIIDRAINEATAALETDPASAFLRTHVDRAFRRKVEYLREMSVIAGWSL